MEREIFVVDAKIIDANGTYNTLSGYPKQFDSLTYNNNIVTARNRAYAEYHECLGAMYKRSDRQFQTAWIMQLSRSLIFALETVGDIPEVLEEPEE